MSELNTLIEICQSNIKNSNKILSYLKKDRGLSDKEIVQFKIGSFPKNVSKLTEYVSAEFLQKAMIMGPTGNSKFADRYPVIFPIYDEYKEPVAIMGRTLLDEHQRTALGLSKYENSSYQKSKTLYGLDLSRSDIVKNQNVFVVEGIFDVIAMRTNGIKNVVAICGSAFSRYHLYKLAKYTKKITFMLDSDSSGQNSMERIYKNFANHGIKVMFCKLPVGFKDVDEYFKAGKTIESFRQETKPFIPIW